MADLVMEYHRTQEYYDQGGWRGTWAMDGGGALMNQGIHGIDLLQYVMGPVKSVSARIATLVRRIEVEDTAAVVIEFESGALATVQATTSVYPGYPRRLGIHGDRGSIVLEEDSLVAWDLLDPGEGPLPVLGKTSSKASSDPGAVGTEGHIRQLGDFADAIRTGRRPLVDGAEGRKAIEIILAAYESSREGRPVLLGR
jgi:predicted dehydrogenase